MTISLPSMSPISGNSCCEDPTVCSSYCTYRCCTCSRLEGFLWRLEVVIIAICAVCRLASAAGTTDYYSWPSERPGIEEEWTTTPTGCSELIASAELIPKRCFCRSASSSEVLPDRPVSVGSSTLTRLPTG